MNTKYYYMMGLPASGKTTFLVAFTYMLLEQTERVYLHMNPLDEQEGLTEDFRKEINRWTNFETVNHTSVGQVHKMKYKLHDASGTKYILEVPDRSGESFEAIIRDRYVDDDIKEDWIKAEEILFFINFERMDIGDREELLTEIPHVLQELLISENRTVELKKETIDSNMFPGQFTLVELLQILYFVRKKAVNIKFIISAWDIVEKSYEGVEILIPRKVFEDKLPLVYQFINTNKDWFNVQYWGVSAQGSDLTDEEEVVKMSYAVEAMERVKVVTPIGDVSFDLSKIFIE